MGKYDEENELVDIKKIYPTTEDKEAMMLLFTKRMEARLKSINNVLNFFTLLFIIGAIVLLFQSCMP